MASWAQITSAGNSAVIDNQTETLTENSVVLHENQEEIKKLRTIFEVAGDIATGFNILQPVNNGTLSSGVIQLNGTWSGNYQELRDHKAWIIVEKDGDYFPASSEAKLAADKSWSSVIELSIQGDYELYLVLLDKTNCEWVERWVKYAHGWSFKSLPKEAIQLKSMKFRVI